MKIFTKLLMLLLTLSSFYANGQTVATYSFAQSSGSYTPITGGTNFASLASSYLDDNVYSAAPIGFSFTYAGTAYTQFGINANGWISLGGTTPSSSNTALSTGATNNVIAAMNNDLIGRGSLLVSTTSGSPTVTVTGGNINLINVGDAVSCTGVTTGSTVLSKTATTVTISANASSTGTGRHFRFVSPSAGIRYETIGSAPNRILVVQWTGFQRYTTTGAFGELYNFQIRLTETSNTVETVYDILGPTSTTTNTYQIGLRGSAATDFNNRTSTTDWSATTAGGANTATITLSNTVKPASGQTYTWTLPTPCTTPAPGNTIASVSAACSGVSFNLSLQNSVPGSGVTYQWQSANDAGFTSGVTNLGTAATQTTSQTAAKYYRCNVTCSVGPVTVASTPVQVTMDVPTNCYCTPTYSSGCSGDDMTSVTLGSLSSTGLSCTAPFYQNLSSTQNAIPNLQQSGTGNVVITFATPGTQQFSRVWIDFDQSGTFETGESFSLGTSGSANPVTIPITIPAGATLGNTRMRVRGGDDSAILATQSCGASSSNWGMARDYTVNIVAATCTSPVVSTTTVVPDCANNQYSYTFNVTSLGSSASLSITGGDATPTTISSVPTTVTVGPFASGAAAHGVTVVATDNTCDVTVAAPATYTCPPANDLCAGAINLNPSAAASGSVSSTTVGAANDYSGPCNSGNTSPDLFYYIDVPNGYVLVIGQTVNGYDSEIYAGYGGSCPGTTQIACYDDADIQNTTWTNTTGSTQTVYWVQDGYLDGTTAGTFTLAWTLTVAPSAPDCAALNTPANAATGVVRNTPLTWTAAATGGTPTGYKVYLGTATNPALVATVNAPATTYTPTGQAYSTTYYWRVVPTNATGDAVGCTTEYSYTTEAPPAGATCANPAVINAYPYSGSGTTCGFGNDYGTQCSGNYGAGEDYVYQLDITTTGVYNINLSATGGGSYIGWFLKGSADCATGANCLTNAVSGSGTAANGTYNFTSAGTYYLIIDMWPTPNCSAFTLSITPPAAAPNCATLGTPADAATNVVRNTPLTWTAPASGPTPTAYKVYLGTVNPPTTLVGSPTGTTYTPTGQAYNTTYYWYVVPTNSGTDAVGCNATVFSYTTEAPPPPPVNDACAGATALVCNASAISGSTVNTVAETAPSACLGQYGVWYTFTGDGSNVTITCDAATGFDQEIVVFSGACGSLTEISCEDQGFDGGIETYSMSTTNATTYYVYVAHYSTSATSTQTGTFTIGLTCTPANNDCSGAININGNGGQAGQPTGVPVAATTVGATQSLANTCGGNADDDVWFTYTTDIDGGNVTINVTPSGGFDPVIELYSGSCGAPVSIACTNATQLNFTGQAASTTYFIRVYDFGTGLVGDVEERSAGGFTIAVLGAALPIELTAFTGKTLDHSNLLQWTTATERNVQSHNIERSLNGINNWTLVGQTASKGDAQTAQSYSLEDRAPLTQSYYRLRTVDNDGQEQLSQVITLTRKDARFGILSAFPNPATESIAVQFNTNEEGTVTARITDVTGRLVAQQQMGAEKGINMLPIQLGQLSTGSYFVTLQNGSNITEPVRFVKQ